MRLLFSSFGLGTTLFNDYFYRMPAISMAQIGSRFVPDYPILLMFDEFVIDSKTMERITNSSYRSWYNDFDEIIKVMNSSGRLIVKDFEEIIEPNLKNIEKSVKSDLKNINEWTPVFKESIERWRSFAKMGKKILSKKEGEKMTSEEYMLMSVFEHGYYGHSATLEREFGNLLSQWKKKMTPEDRNYTRYVVKEYLTYISANLSLAENTNSFIHDWNDIEPIYNKKFNIVTNNDSPVESYNKARQLFSIVFPEFQLNDAKKFIKILEDKRIESLRELIKKAATEKVTFDEEYANSTLRDVLKIEQKVKYKRKVVGWATFPLGFIPWLGTPIQKATEEIISKSIEKKEQSNKEWYYLISQISK